MSSIIKLTTFDGQHVEIVDKIIGSGAMKDVYFSPDKTYVVAFFKQDQDCYKSKSQYEAHKERLLALVTEKWNSIFNGIGGDYWKNLYCWPKGIVEYSINGNKLIGIVAPSYQHHFFFEYGSKNNDFLGIKGKEKEGKWFASANNRCRFVDQRELGTWLNHLKICVLLSRAVRRMHAAGLAHSDLSYKNVLIDPAKGNACIIDVDGLVVPGKYPPDVQGTPDFIAPEVVKTSHLPKDHPDRKLPCIATDRHALAVLIYMYLFYRHPLRGRKVHNIDDTTLDENLSMGERALFVEHPTDNSNRIKVSHVRQSELPWADTSKIPYTTAGPYLAPLFLEAFVDGLHQPNLRPTADAWETALVRTVDLIQPCQNPACEQKWFVFDNKTKPSCPFCGTVFKGKLPILNLYSSRGKGSFKPDNHRLMVWTGQSLFQWHVNRLVAPNEKLTDDQKKRVGYFVFHNGAWWLVNEGMPSLTDMSTKITIPIGGKVELKDGIQLLLSPEEGGRLVLVQMVECA
jgi:serine/threonine protein kinase